MIGTTLGIITPHPPIMVAEVGGDRAHVTAESIRSMEVAARLLAAYDPEAIVLMSPHAPITSAAFAVDASPRYAGDLGQFGARSTRIAPSGDPALAHAIIEAADRLGLSAIERAERNAGQLDHGALVPLSFLDKRARYPLVMLSPSLLPLADHRRFGEAVSSAARSLGRRVAFVASGDCSHRLTESAPAGFSPQGKEFDDVVVHLLRQGDYTALMHIDPELIDRAGECGLRSFVTLGGFLSDAHVTTRVLSYEGPWGVGYTTAVAASTDLLALIDHPDAIPAPEIESEPVALARSVIKAYLRDRRVVAPPVPSGLLAGRHGAFVTLHRRGDLRGCIGTIAPTMPTLAEEVAHNAIKAATADPRFPPLTADELDDLVISVDVIHEPEPATPEDLDPRTWGIIVSADWRRGVLLPDLEGVDTAEQQISIARQKAGIGPTERARLERFKVDRYQ